MKKLVPIMATMMLAAAAFGQGQFNFTNRDIANGVNARFVHINDAGPISSIGTDYTITLTGGPAGGTLVPLEPSTATFRGPAGSNGAGYISPIVVTVPGVPPGASADVRVKISGPGGNWEGMFMINGLGSGTTGLPTSPMGANSLTIGPEPTTIALGTLGLGALLAIRRRE